MLRYGNGSSQRSSTNIGSSKPIIVKDATTGQTTSFAQPVVSSAIATSALASATTTNSLASTQVANSSLTRDVAQTDSSGRRYVILQNGDTLFRIAHKYSVSAKQLEQINNLHSQSIKIGMKLYLDPKNN
jgi:LysM repeat protein